jgi:hypothetical protein
MRAYQRLQGAGCTLPALAIGSRNEWAAWCLLPLVDGKRYRWVRSMPVGDRAAYLHSWLKVAEVRASSCRRTLVLRVYSCSEMRPAHAGCREGARV